MRNLDLSLISFYGRRGLYAEFQRKYCNRYCIAAWNKNSDFRDSLDRIERRPSTARDCLQAATTTGGSSSAHMRLVVNDLRAIKRCSHNKTISLRVVPRNPSASGRPACLEHAKIESQKLATHECRFRIETTANFDIAARAGRAELCQREASNQPSERLAYMTRDRRDSRLAEERAIHSDHRQHR
jgi:hypothetical protein